MALFPRKRKCEVNFIEETIIVIRGEKFHRHDHELQEIKKLLLQILKTNRTMSAALDALKAKVAAQSTALDTIGTNVDGIKGDVAFLKQKIESLADGATADEIAELSTSVGAVSTKLDAIGTATATLDAETDPNA